MLRLWLFITALILSTCTAMTGFEVLGVADNFAKQFLYPNNLAQAKVVNSTLFAEDVVGSVDIAGNFDTRMLATEYMFGLFSAGLDEKSPSPFGTPVSYNLSSLLVQNNIVAAGIKFEFFLPTLNINYPFEIDVWLNVNGKGQIQEYDVAFRRWAWGTDLLIQQLIPYMAEWLNITGPDALNSSLVLPSFLIHETCIAAMQYCTGENAQYSDVGSCTQQLAAKPLGTMYRLGEDNVSCRYLHKNLLVLRPDIHCPQVGPSGGDMCTPHSYSDVVRDNHFPRGFLAPRQVTPENKFITDKMSFNSSYQPNALLAMSMLHTDYSHTWEPTQFALCTFGFLLVLWASAKVVFFLFLRNRNFAALSHRNRTNVTMYVLNIFYTTLALALQLAACGGLAGDFSLWGTKCLRIAGVVTCSLYCFELIFRFDMRWPLVMHHVITVIAVSMCIATQEYTLSTTYWVSGLLWLFQATTEQTIFVGLMGFRLNWNKRRTMLILKASALQALIIKTSSAVAVLVWWGVKEHKGSRPFDIGWAIVVWVCSIGLLATQFWGSWVTYKIGVRVEKQMREEQVQAITVTVDAYKMESQSTASTEEITSGSRLLHDTAFPGWTELHDLQA